MENRIYGSTGHHHQPQQQQLHQPSPCHLATSHNPATHQLVFKVRLDAHGGPLGITLSGSEDQQKPILISGLLEDGCAYSTRQICVGDCLLAINGESVQDVPLSRATQLLQQGIGGSAVELKLTRNIGGGERDGWKERMACGKVARFSNAFPKPNPDDSTHAAAASMMHTSHSVYAATQTPKSNGDPTAAQPQAAVYAKVQRRAERNALLYNATTDGSGAGTSAASTSSATSSAASGGAAAGAGAGQGQLPGNCANSLASKEGSAANLCRTFHVTLYKDTVYDDYGFSLSDGLYERGVFINRIRSGGPADVVGLLKPFDRIMQVSGNVTIIE